MAIQLQNRVALTIQLSKPVTFGHPDGFECGFADVDATWLWGPPVSPSLSFFSPLPLLSPCISRRPAPARLSSSPGRRCGPAAEFERCWQGRQGRPPPRAEPRPWPELEAAPSPPLGGATRSPSRAFLEDLGVPSMRPCPCSPRGPPCSSMPPSIPGEQGAVAAQPSPPPPAALNSLSPVRFPSISCAGSFPVLSSPDSSPHPVDSPTAGRPQRSSIATAAGRRRPASSPPLPTLSLAGELHRALCQLH